MFSFKVIFWVNNYRTEQIVRANSSSEARKLIEAQYAGQKLRFGVITKV